MSDFYIYATSIDLEKVKEYYKEDPVVDLNDRWKSEYGFEYARTEDKKLRLQFRSESDLVMFSMRFCK